MMTRHAFLPIATVLSLLAGITAAQQTQPNPTAAPATTAPDAKATALTATVTGVEGKVQVRDGEDQPWKPVVVGMVVSQGAEFRTGPRSAVRLVILPDQTITLDRLGNMKLIEAMQTGNKVKTDLGMKYGRTRYEIEAAGLEHESKIASPNSTLAVRGTQANVYDQPPFAPEAVVLTGHVDYKRAGKAAVAFGAKGRRSSVGGDANDPGEQSLLNTFVDAGIANARTEAEREVLLIQSRSPYTVHDQLEATSALLDFIATADFTNPITAQENRTRQTPGALAFDLVWQGAADLDLSLVTPRGERLSAFPFLPSPDGLIANSSTNVVPSGGRIDFDDQGPNEPGAPSNSGRETAYWTGSYPTGKYVVKVSYAEGAIGQAPSSASYTLTVAGGNESNSRVINGVARPGTSPQSYTITIKK